MFIFNRYDTVYRESAKWSDIGHTRATNWCARHQRSPPQSFLHASHFRQVRGRRDQSQLHYQHSAATCIMLTTSLSLNSCWRKSCGLPWQDTRMSQFTDLRSCSSWGCVLLRHALNASMWRPRGPRDRWWKRLTDAYVSVQKTVILSSYCHVDHLKALRFRLPYIRKWQRRLRDAIVSLT